MTKSDPWVICRICEGDGTYVNPAIDAHGLTADDFADDPDFAEGYISGVYDVACRHCGGSGKMRRSDDATLTDRLAAEADARRLAAAENGDWEGFSIATDPRW